MDSYPVATSRRGTDQPIPDLVPDLAVEVLSPSNTKHEMATKLREYFAAGVRIVWYADPPAPSPRPRSGLTSDPATRSTAATFCPGSGSR